MNSLDKVDVAILGDSIVYGHGVEEPDTIAGCLRSGHGLTVGNFGLTGAGPVHYVAFARNYAFRHRPRATVVVVFANDLADISAERSPTAMRQFVETHMADEMQVLPVNELARSAPHPGWATRLVGQSFFLRAVAFGWRGLGRVPVAHAAPASRASSTDAQGSGLEIEYLRTALRVIAEDARKASSTLLIVYVPAVQSDFARENFRIPSVLADMATDAGFRFVDATESLMVDAAHEKPGTRLAGDGHLSGEGACLVADLISESLHAPAAVAPLGRVVSITSPEVRLVGFWNVERDPVSAFAWTKSESTLEVSGLPPDAPLFATLYVRDTGGTTHVLVTSPDGERREVAVTSEATTRLRQTFHVDDEGRVRIRLGAHTFRPSDRGPSNDNRDLGIAISAVQLVRQPMR